MQNLQRDRRKKLLDWLQPQKQIKWQTGLQLLGALHWPENLAKVPYFCPTHGQKKQKGKQKK